jgi:hypothetical protein
MRTVKRPRRYVAPRLITLTRPVLRYSQPRQAYVLRVVGRKWGPVLRPDRRHESQLEGAPERRSSHARVA